jgi:alkanesulfonate monooxygenase SsuD/methylene tetrahydromethanopterin reductase-like flavin-dependent oxidoreductase (luciferase family)
MKFVFFHLMPYADLDPGADKTPSAWVTLPNSYYDPKKGAALYKRYLDELVYAAELGFDGVAVNEHHETAYGLMPCPDLFAANLIARLPKQTKIAVLGRALPITENPLTIAEEFAVLDNLSEGRLIAGFVRGVGTEYHVTGANPGQSLARFREAHDLIIQAWTKPGPFAFEGKFYHFNYVNLWPRCYQQPHPPVWIPSQGSAETIEFASHPDRKYVYLHTFSPFETVQRFMDAYRERAERYGYTSQPDRLGWGVPMYVADTDEQALREATPHIESFYNRFLRSPNEYKAPPGYTSMSSMKQLIELKLKYRQGAPSIDTILKLGMAIVGSADTVAETLIEKQKAFGIGNLIGWLHFGTLPADLTKKNLELFAKKVMPRLRPLGEPAPAAKPRAEAPAAE